jgi:hypothetical protein
MKRYRRATQIKTASLLLGLLGGCSLETTGSGDFPLNADDDGDETPDTGPVRTGDSGDAGQSDPDGGQAGSSGDDDDDDDSMGDDDDDGLPTSTSKCRAGSYTGTYSCKQPTSGLPWAMGLGGGEITGSFTFQLRASGKADSFTLEGGELHNDDVAFFKLDATIEATLECGRPLQGKLVDATHSGLFGPPTSFESSFDATYNESRAAFENGTFTVADGANTQCNGTWSATRG